MIASRPRAFVGGPRVGTETGQPYPCPPRPFSVREGGVRGVDDGVHVQGCEFAGRGFGAGSRVHVDKPWQGEKRGQGGDQGRWFVEYARPGFVTPGAVNSQSHPMKTLLLALTATAGLATFSPAANAQYLGRPPGLEVDRDGNVRVERVERERRVERELREARDVRERDLRDRDGLSRDRRDREVIVERAPKRNLNDGYDRVYNNRRRKTVYIIERGRPVRRDVFFDGRGRYYRIIDDRPVFIQERVFESYPERYYHRDGRARAGITLNFGG